MFNSIIDRIKDPAFWQSLMTWFEGFGMLGAVALAMIESLIPALPLIAIVALNVTVHGLVLGFIYSWIGTCFGSAIVFMFFRVIAQRPKIAGFLNKDKSKISKIRAWVRKQSVLMIMVLSALPFTPSSFMNMAFGLSDYNPRHYLGSILIGKSISIFVFALFGEAVDNMKNNPWILVGSLVLLTAVYFISRRISKKTGMDAVDDL